MDVNNTEINENELEITQEDIDNSESMQKEEMIKQKKKPSKKSIIITSIVCTLVIGVSAFGLYSNNKKNTRIYTQANSLMEQGSYEQAMEVYATILGFKDAQAKYDECNYNVLKAKYDEAIALKEGGKYSEASEIFTELGSFEDSSKQSEDSLATERSLYVKYLGTEIYKINKYKELAMSTVNIIIRDWTLANSMGVDATTMLTNTYNEWGTTVNMLNIGYDGLRTQVNDIVELESASKAYDKFMEIYNVYLEIHECAVSPSGELNEYIKNVNEYSKKFDSLIEELYTMEIEVKQQAIAEMEAADEKEIQEANKIIAN